MNRLIQFCKDKAKLNLTIDFIMFILLMAMAGIGLLIKYVLLPGMQRNLKYGNDIDLEYLGMDRHQWGSIHLIISIIFLILIIIHIVLHWKMVVCILQRMMPGRTWQVAVIGSIAFISLLLISFPLFIKPEQVPHEPLYRGRLHSTGYFSRGSHMGREHQPIPEPVKEPSAVNSTPLGYDSSGQEETKRRFLEDTILWEQAGESGRQIRHKDGVLYDHHETYDEFDVTGNQTLQSVANRYDVPAAVICRDLKIPEHLAGERLGRLKKMYPFTMSDVRKSIYIYKRQN